MTKQVYEDTLRDCIADKKATIELIACIGKLRFDKSVELVIFRNQMVDRSSSELLNFHLYAREVVKHSLRRLFPKIAKTRFSMSVIR